MAPAGATNCRRGDLTWRRRGKKLRTKKRPVGNFWMTRTGSTGGGRADGQIGGGQADCGERADGRTARRMEADERTSGWADESGRGADRADWRSGGRVVGRTGGQAGDLKVPAPRSPLHS